MPILFPPHDSTFEIDNFISEFSQYLGCIHRASATATVDKYGEILRQFFIDYLLEII